MWKKFFNVFFCFRPCNELIRYKLQIAGGQSAVVSPRLQNSRNYRRLTETFIICDGYVAQLAVFFIAALVVCVIVRTHAIIRSTHKWKLLGITNHSTHKATIWKKAEMGKAFHWNGFIHVWNWKHSDTNLILRLKCVRKLLTPFQVFHAYISHSTSFLTKVCYTEQIFRSEAIACNQWNVNDISGSRYITDMQS